MTNCRVSIDELNHDREQSRIDSLFEMGLLEFKCKHCKDTMPNKDMKWISDISDEGICNDCAELQEVQEYYEI